jgi:ATP-dependent DNA helicase RecQ
MGQVNKFGKEFIELIRQYAEEHDIETVSDVVVKTSVNKSKIKIFIIQQIDRQISLDEIASSKSVSFDELLTEIENICYSGTKLNLDYYLDEILDEDKQEIIFDYFLNSETDSIEDAVAELKDEDPDFNEDNLRLMRVKFLSEYAN